jgi:hypothetical protein
MKKIAFLLIIIFSLFLFGCTSSDQTNTSESSVKLIECSDYECFANAAKTCESAKGTVLTELAFMESFIISSSQNYVMEKEGDACKITVTQETYGMKTSDGSELPPEMAEGSKVISKDIIGKQGICIMSMEEMSTIFTEWSQGILSTAQTSKCTGDLYNN